MTPSARRPAPAASQQETNKPPKTHRLRPDPASPLQASFRNTRACLGARLDRAAQPRGGSGPSYGRTGHDASDDRVGEPQWVDERSGCDRMQQRVEPARRKISDDTRASAPATAPPTTNSAVASPPPGCEASRAKKTASPITAGRKMTRSGPQNRAALPGSAMSAQMLAKLAIPRIAYLL